MAPLLFIIGGDVVNALAFKGTNFTWKNEARVYINNFDKAMVEYYKYLQKNTSITAWAPIIRFLSSIKGPKMVNYYLLQWLQAWQHMPYTSTLNKWR